MWESKQQVKYGKISLILLLKRTDVAILAIAAHAALYVFRPPKRVGKGGLYAYRRAVYTTYTVWPLLSTCIAFSNHDAAFVNFEIYCNYPKRPFWYRLALSWVPRYTIFFVMICLYVAIYAHVKFKFNGFGKFESHNGSISVAQGTETEKSTIRFHSQSNTEDPSLAEPSSNAGSRKASVVSSLLSKANHKEEIDCQRNAPEWEQVDFITAPQVSNGATRDRCVSDSDFARETITSNGNQSGSPSPPDPDARMDSERPQTPSLPRTISETRTVDTVDTDYTLDNNTTTLESHGNRLSLRRTRPRQSQLARTRHDIKRQLRFMFTYPLVYIIMWTLPFINHCFVYSTWWAVHTPFSLTVASTACLALQAGVDSLVFSWREKPWRRKQAPVPDWSKRCLNRFLAFIKCVRNFPSRNTGDDIQQAGSRPKLEARRFSSQESHWWEVEGRRRKDSVWMGTDSVFSVLRPSSESRELNLSSLTQPQSTKQRGHTHKRSRSSGFIKRAHTRAQDSRLHVKAGKEATRLAEGVEARLSVDAEHTEPAVSDKSESLK